MQWYDHVVVVILGVAILIYGIYLERREEKTSWWKTVWNLIR